MKYYLLLVLFFLTVSSAKAGDKDSTVYYNLPDSVKALQFMAEIDVTSLAAKYFMAGISTNAGTLRFSAQKGKRTVSFITERLMPKIIIGKGVKAAKDIKYSHYDFDYNWQLNKTYKLLIAMAADSAAGFSLISAYIFLPEENKWKLLGTSRHQYGNVTLNNLQTFFRYSKKGSAEIYIGDTWCQRSNGSWKNMKDENLPSPTVNLFGHIDSVQQHETDIKLIEDAIASGKIDTKNNEQGVYYTIMKEGTGRQVSVNDTVTVNYRLRLINDTTIIQETKDKPATFPLKRLIKGWQIGVPLCKVGGRIRLVIPSDLAYSIRTRAANIPPNSILVFEIEVLDAKAPL